MELILNWLWQGAVVALAAEGVLAAIPRSRTQVRYWFAGTACVLVLALPAVPYIGAAASSVSTLDHPAVSLVPLVSMPTAWWTSTPLVIVLWIVWSVVHVARLAAAAVAVQDVKRQCRECPDAMEVRLPHWSRVKATGRRARLVLSAHVRSAAVLGCGSPTIAISPALLGQLDDADLDRIVIHEWAHVQRRDDIVQLVQRLGRIAAGWHPAVWWLERRLELEREVACDEIAVALTGSAKGYAACLATLAALPAGPVGSLPALAMSSSGVRRRLLRILAARRVESVWRWRAIAVCASVALATLAFAVGHVQVAQSAATSSSVPIATRVAADVLATSPSITPGAAAPAAFASSSASRGSVQSSEDRVRPAERDDNSSGARTSTRPSGAEPPAAVMAVVPSRHLQPPIDGPLPNAVGTHTLPEPPLSSRVEAPWMSSIPGSPSGPDMKPRSPWMAAADGGVAIGRRSQNAGVATASFFSRVGKKIADSF